MVSREVLALALPPTSRLGTGGMPSKLQAARTAAHFGVPALAGYGLEVVERIPIEIQPNEANMEYLHTKQKKLGHMLKWQYEKEII